MLKVLASSVRRFLSIIWSIDGTRLARLAKRQSLHGVGKNVWSAPTKLGKDGHYRDSLPRQRARSYHQYWPTSCRRSLAECVRNVMIGVLMDTQTCSKYASQMHCISSWHSLLLNDINNATIERWNFVISTDLLWVEPNLSSGGYSINTIAFAWFIKLTV